MYFKRFAYFQKKKIKGKRKQGGYLKKLKEVGERTLSLSLLERIKCEMSLIGMSLNFKWKAWTTLIEAQER